jgi:PAS domain S-box-containing protein
MGQWSADFLRGVLDAAPEGIVVCESSPEHQPVVYVNTAFERMTGYQREELMGQDLRRLQAWDREQEGRNQLRAAIGQGETCRVLLRNYRKDGSQFWNEILVQPLRGATGAVTHFVGFHRDVSERERPGCAECTGLPSWLREDRLSGLCSRAYFEELLQHDWQIGARESRLVTLIVFDIDDLDQLQRHLRPRGRRCLHPPRCRSDRRGVQARRRRGSALGRRSHRRAGAQSGSGGGAVVRGLGGTEGARSAYSSSARRTAQKFVSVSVGAASLKPVGEQNADVLVQAAMKALRAPRKTTRRRSPLRPEDAQ